MFVVSLAVSPLHYRSGVGTALLEYGTKMADKKCVFIWVHSSMGAVKSYESVGFKRVGSLDMDLDEYAPRPPRCSTTFCFYKRLEQNLDMIPS